jgi:hypothetical protein
MLVAGRNSRRRRRQNGNPQAEQGKSAQRVTIHHHFKLVPHVRNRQSPEASFRAVSECRVA